MMVPTPIPTILKLKNTSESMTASATQKTSNAIFKLPKSRFILSATTSTIASAGFRTLSAMIVTDIPNARTVAPRTVNKSLTIYRPVGMYENAQTPNSVNHPKITVTYKVSGHVFSTAIPSFATSDIGILLL